MIFKRNITFLAIITFLTISVMLSETSAQTPEMNSNNLLNQLAGNSVEGVWNLNIDESDDMEQKIQTLIQKSIVTPDKALSAEKTDMPSVSISIFPPERLVLLRNENEMTINEFFTDVILTRTLKTDGKPHLYQLNNNTNVAVSTVGEKKKLSIETLSPRGNQMMETFELSADGSKLKVTIQISDSNFQELLTLQRIYDREILDNFSNYN